MLELYDPVVVFAISILIFTFRTIHDEIKLIVFFFLNNLNNPG